MRTTPTTPADFRRYGQRFDSENILKQADALIPLAATYLVMIKGYDAKMFENLKSNRSVLEGKVAQRKLQREGSKKGSRTTEQRLMREAKLLHREALTVLKNALRSRFPAEGETEEQTEAIMDRFDASLDSQKGSVGSTPQKAKVKLTGLLALIIDPDIVTRFQELAEGKDYRGEIEKLLPRLEESSQTKKGSQQDAIVDTADLDELDGRIYINLKALVDAGRSTFNRLGDSAKASLFNLDILNRVVAPKGDPTDKDQASSATEDSEAPANTTPPEA